MSLIFDTHAHYDDSAFDEDREEVLSGLLSKGVGLVVNAGAAARSIPRILELAHRYDFLYAAAGLHPCECYGCGDNTGEPVMRLPEAGSSFPARIKENAGNALECKKADAKEEGKNAYSLMAETLALYDSEEIITADWTATDREMQLVKAMLADPKTVAVGEIGLDYHYDDTRKDVQKEWFASQIALARQLDYPIIIHSRDAAADTLDMVKSENARDVGGIVHCFSYAKEMAAHYLDLGFVIGVGGVVTFKNSKKLKEVVAYAPLDRIVLETDCPYLAPAPFRGKRNDSTMIHYAAEAIAGLKGTDAETVIAVTEQTAKQLFRV